MVIRFRIWDHFRRANLCLAVGLLLLLGACRNLSTTGPVNGTASDSGTVVVTIDSSMDLYSIAENSNAVYQFYKNRHFKTVWLDHNGLNSSADSLIQMNREARKFGLLDWQSSGDAVSSMPDSNGMWFTEAEILLTDNFIRLARVLKSGRRYSGEMSIPDSALLGLLEQSIVTNTVARTLRSLQPHTTAYTSLQRALVLLLEKRDSLRKPGINGEPDCVMLDKQIGTVALNMDRLREDQFISGRYILVNIPAYELRVVDEDSTRFTSKVIVGTAKDPTPVLSSKVFAFSLFPYWTVPRRIAVSELLPKIQKNRAYLDEHGFVLLDRSGAIVDASGIDFTVLNRHNFPYTLRQNEGSANSLGIIKFSFDNPYSVYLHDTNAPSLFRKDKRALSHGCVRVEKAINLARVLLLQNGASDESLDRYLRARKKATLMLKPPIPIFIRYYTAEVLDGELKIYDDVYGKDSRELNTIAKNEQSRAPL